MNDESMSERRPGSFAANDLRSVSTRWSAMDRPQVFALRYVEPMRHYLRRLLRDENDVDDVLQKLLVKFLENGFSGATPDRGRFRHYLIRSVANEARTWVRQRRDRDECFHPSEDVINQIADADAVPPDQAWDEDWKANLLQRAHRAVLAYQDAHPNNRFYDLLQIVSRHPDETSRQWHRQFVADSGGSISDVAFRKQLSRARAFLAKQIIAEVAATLDTTADGALEDELRSLGWTRWLTVHQDASNQD